MVRGIPSSRRAILAATIFPLLFLFAACDELASDDPIVMRDDSFDVSGEITIDVDVFNGKIDITGSDTSTVRVQARITRADRVDYSAEQFGSSIQVSATRTGSSGLNSPNVGLDITAPSNSMLILQTNNGAIEVRNFDAGAILDTTNGRIVVSGLNGDLEAETSNGAIEVSGFTGSANLETSNGAIRFNGTLVSGSDNEMSTSNGSVTVDVPTNSGITLDASTSNGSVSSDLPITLSSSGNNHLEGVIGDGSAELTIRSSNGFISVR